MRFYPIECDFSGNRFSGNWRNIEYRVGSGEKGVKDIARVEFIRTRTTEEIAMDSSAIRLRSTFVICRSVGTSACRRFRLGRSG